MPPKLDTTWITKSEVAVFVSAFAVVSGIILTALNMPAHELIIGGGLGYLLGKIAK